MRAVDWVVFAAFLGWVVWDGVRRSRGTRDLDSYFAGGRAIPWWAAGLSVMATQASAITVIGTTSQGHEAGLGFVQFYFGLPFAMIAMCVLLVPLYRRLPILTAYQYLEERLGVGTRTLASLVFLVSRGMALGIVVYAPSVALSAMTGLDRTTTVLIMGVLTTGYTMLGGVKAVIWTDVKQMLVIVFGLLLCFGLLLVELLPQLGVGGGLAVLGAADRLEALQVVPQSTDLVPAVQGAGGQSFWQDRYNLWSGLIGGFFLQLAYFGADQSQVQRILTNPTADDSRRALLVSAFAKVPMQAFVLLIGVLIYLFHVVGDEPLFYDPAERAVAAERQAVVAPIEARWHEVKDERRELAAVLAGAEGGPRAVPDALARFQQLDREAATVRAQARSAIGARNKDTNFIFLHYILHEMPPVLLGLIIAAIFAAAMSSIDSVLNSLSAATVVDFYRRLLRPAAADRELLVVSRAATLLWGGFAIYFALVLGGRGSIIETINRVGSYFYGSLLGVFLLSLLVRRAGPWAGMLGLGAGMGGVYAVSVTLEVEYLWFNLIGVMLVLGVGWIVSRFEPQR